MDNTQEAVIKIVIFDLETKNSPVTKADWTNWEWLGISVGCAYDFQTGEYSVYLDDNIEKLAQLLNAADMIAAFNHVHFDNNLLRGVLKSRANTTNWPQLKPDSELLNYDMLLESRAGAKVDMYTKGFKLDAHLRATLGPTAMKTGDGAMAPDLYKAGKTGELISYCLADVHRERLLFEHVWAAGNLSCEHHGGAAYAVKRPQEYLGGQGVVANFPLRDVAHITGPREIAARIGQQAAHLLGMDVPNPDAIQGVQAFVHVTEEPLKPLGGPEHGHSPFRPDTTNPEDL